MKEVLDMNDYFDYSALMGGLAEDIGVGKYTIEEVNRYLSDPRQPVEEIYFGNKVTFNEHIELHGALNERN